MSGSLIKFHQTNGHDVHLAFAWITSAETTSDDEVVTISMINGDRLSIEGSVERVVEAIEAARRDFGYIA